MYKMNRMKKILPIILFIVMLLNLLVPTVALAADEVEGQLENVEKQDEKDKILQENQDEIIEEEKEKSMQEEQEEVVEDVKEEVQQITDQIKKTEKDSILAYGNKELKLSVTDGENIINGYIKNNRYYIFVTKDIDISNLVIKYEGDVVSSSFGNLNKEEQTITGDFTTTEDFTLNLENDIVENVSVIQSDVPAIFVNLHNNVTQKTLNSGSKDTKYPASVNITGADDEIYNISDDDIEIKGRGNTTWAMDKKPYQIKFSKKQNLLGMGKDKSKKWVLLANYADTTLLKNKIMDDLCVDSGLSNIPNAKFIDLYINGDYVGNYLACEKIEVGDGRVELNDDKGVLVELDNAYYYDEDYNFQSNYSGNHYVIKEFKNDDMEDAQKKETMLSFKKSLENFEKKLYVDCASWDEISKLIDVESFAKFYILNEFTKNLDTYFSSTYLYKDGKNDVIHMGPLWDYDKQSFEGDTNVDYSTNLYNHMSALYKYPEFAKLVNEIYENELKQLFNKISVNEYSNNIIKSSRINSIVWKSEETYNKRVKQLNSWVESRKEYFNKRYSIIKPTAYYSTHVQDIGWINTQYDNAISGTIGKGLKMESIRICATDIENNDLSIKYQTHVENIGWQNWVENGETAGTIGQSLRVEAIRIKLNDTSEYSVKYRVHVQDYGWMDWKQDGEIAGTEGESKRIEAIQIQIIKKPKIEINYTYNEDINTVTATITSDKPLSSINDTSWILSEDKLIYTKEYNYNDTYKIKVKDIDGIEEELEVKIAQVVEPISLVKYNSHIQDYGWERKYSRIDGQMSGTSGESKRIESIKISLGNSEEIPENAVIKYQVHVQDYGWMDWKQNGEMAGTEGKSKRIEAFKIKLEGMENYSVEYRVHIQDIGWQKWRKNGEIAGTEGQSKRIEAIEIRIIEKGLEILEPEVSYQSHVQDIGWQNKALEGTLAGTEGQAKRIEALKINLSDGNENAKIKYRTHVQDIGWQAWVRNGAIAGTEGKNKRIEAIQIELEDMEEYTVEYKVHIQDYGWSDWMIDGETAGTTGKGKRIEAIKIRIVPKYHREYKGIDVSEFNGEIDWQQVKNSGVQFAMIRCGYRGYRTGKIVTDPQFDYNVKNASAAGIKVGIYFFSQATSISEAAEEANYAIELAKKYDCITYPIAIDTEMSTADNNDGRADGLNVALRTNVVAAFCNEVQRNGYTPMVYASRDWLYDNLEIDRLSIYDTWLAHYTESPDIKSDYKYGYTMWQYTSSGSIPGVSSERVDLNIGYKKY